MRLLILVRAKREADPGFVPDSQLYDAVGRFNDELVAAGVIRSPGGGRCDRRDSGRALTGAQRVVVDGLFAANESDVRGFWIWDVASMAEALDWIWRSPFGDAPIEIRPIFETTVHHDVTREWAKQVDRDAREAASA